MQLLNYIRGLHPPSRNTAIAGGIVVTIFFFSYCFRYSENITGFFRFHNPETVSPYLDQEDIFFQRDFGNDGVYFLAIALDPGIRHHGTKKVLGNPGYRYRRILYPLTGYTISFAYQPIIPFALVFINGLCIIGLVYVFSLYFRETGNSLWKSLWVLAVPGLWVIFEMSTADLMSSLFLMASILTDKKGRYRSSALFLCLACLTRETVMLAWAAFVAIKFLEKKWKQLLWLIIGAVPVILWNGHVFYRFRNDPQETGFDRFGVPLYDFISSVSYYLQDFWSVSTLSNLYAYGILFSMAGVVIYRALYHFSENRVIYCVGIFHILFLITGTKMIIHHYIHFNRIYVDLFFIFLLLASESKIERLILIGSAVQSVLLIYFLGL